MRLDPDKLYCDCMKPDVLVDCAKKLCLVKTFNYSDLCALMNTSKDDESAQAMFEYLYESQAMMPVGHDKFSIEDDILYRPNNFLTTISRAFISKGLNKVEAGKLIVRLVAKAKEINKNSDKYPYRVSKMGVFGQYLTSKSEFGDLDLAIDLIPPKKFELLNSEERQHAYVQEMKTRNYLTDKNREFILLYSFEDNYIPPKNIQYQIIFEDYSHYFANTIKNTFNSL